MKSKRIKITLLVLFLVSVFSGTWLTQAQAAAPPTDITGNWALSQISYLVERGIVTGYTDGTFRPNNPVTRAEFCAITNRAFGYAAMTPVSFSDVNSGDWYYDDIAKARAAGYIYGLPDGSMKPNSPITRQEAAVIIAKALALDTSGNLGQQFKDADYIPWWSQGPVSALWKAGLISGYPDGSFRAQNNIHRDEAAAIFYRIMTARTEVTGITLNQTKLNMAVGNSVVLKATVIPEDAYNKEVRWSSSDEKTAVVSDTGEVTALSNGDTTITATTNDGGFTASCAVTVARTGVIQKITLQQDSITIMEGGTYRLVPKIEPLGVDYPKLIWKSDNQEVATVGADGLVTARGEHGDTCKITVSSEQNPRINADCRIEIARFDSEAIEKAHSILLSEDSINIDVDQYYQLWASFAPEDTFNQKIYWSSNKPGTATVNTGGLVKGRSEGSCTIRAYWENDNSLYAECEVNVEPAYGEVVLNNDFITMAPGETLKIRGSFRKIYFKLVSVDWAVNGDDVVEVDIDPYSNYFIANITAAADAKDGDECAIVFTITDTAQNSYETSCRIKIKK